MQYRPPNAYLDSGCQTVSNVSGYNWRRHPLLVGGRTWLTLACFFGDCAWHDKRIMLVTQLRSAGKCVVNITKVHIERNTLQLELIRYSKTMLTLFTFTVAKRRIRPPNA